MTGRERSGAVEVRAEGRRLEGRIIAYGDLSPSHREVFEPGAFSMVAPDLALNLEHRPADVLATSPNGGLEVRALADGLHLRADLPAGPLQDRALADVRNGRLRGLSLEFFARREHRREGVRRIASAFLDAVGLVEVPSYPASGVEARAELRGAALARLLADLIEANPDRLDEAAREAGIEVSTVRQIARNEIDRPPLARLQGFARAFNVDLAQFLDAAGRDGLSYDSAETLGRRRQALPFV